MTTEMRNVILGIILCALCANGNNVIDGFEAYIRQRHSTLLTKQFNGPSTGPSGTTCNSKGICENQPDGALFPDSGSNGYIVCQCECGISMPCPSGLIFNPVIKACDWPLVATGAPGTSSTSSYTSTNGIPSTSSLTPKYTTSSPSSSKSSDVTTKSTPTTSNSPATGPSGTTCNSKGVCENQPDGAMFPDSGSNGYIVCQCECGISMPCPSGLIFNPVIKACDWPLVATGAPGTSSTSSKTSTKGIPSTPSSTPKYTTSSPSSSKSSDVTTKSTPTTSSSPATGPSGTTCNSKGVCENQPDGALFPDSGSNGYIVCQCECGISRPCPSGLVFNPALSVCDWSSTN